MSFIYIVSTKECPSQVYCTKKNIKRSQKQIVFYEGFFKPHYDVQSIWSYGPYLAFLDSSESVFTLIPFITGMAHEATG